MLNDKEIRDTIRAANVAFHNRDNVAFRLNRAILELETHRLEAEQTAAARRRAELDAPIPYTLTAKARLTLAVPSLSEMSDAIRALREEALAAGDGEQADLCAHALNGCTRALVRCALVIHGAE